MTNAKVERCPFCGNVPEVRKGPCDMRFAVICRHCATHGMMVQTQWMETKEKATERWNDRSR